VILFNSASGHQVEVVTQARCVFYFKRLVRAIITPKTILCRCWISSFIRHQSLAALCNKSTLRSTGHVLAVYIPTSLALLAPLTEHELEDVVEDEVASGSVRQKLETLAVVHWSLFLIDLEQN
jgi:hypothetical protein